MTIQPVGITHQFNGDVSATNKVDAAQLDVQLANLANAQNLMAATINKIKTSTSVIAGYYVDVKADYGAVGDGLTDDLAAIQAAIDSLSGGGTVFIPPGTYLLSDTLKLSGSTDNCSNIKLTGAGKTDTILKIADASLKNTIGLTHNSNFEICNFTIYGSRFRGAVEPYPCAIWQPGLRYTKIGSRYSTRPGGTYNPDPLVDDIVWELTTAMPSGVVSDPDDDGILDGADLTYFTQVSGPGVLNKYEYDYTFEESHGIYVSGERGVAKVDQVYIHDLIVKETVYAGICVGAGTSINSIISEGCSNVLVERCQIFDSGATAIGGCRRTNAVIQTNQIFRSDSGGINIDEDGANNIIFANIIDGGDPSSQTTRYEITSVTPTNAGTGYVVGDRLYVGGDTATSDPAICRVTSIDGSGGITGIQLLGRGYFPVVPLATFTGGSGSSATLSIAYGNVYDNTYDTRYGISVYASDGNYIISNIISHCNDGIKLVGVGTDVGSSAANNTIFECGQGIYAYSAETCAISDNTIRDCDTGAINVLTCDNISICGNQITGIALLGAYGIRVRNSLSCTISDNVIDDVAGYGIYANGLRKSTLTSNVIKNSCRITEAPAIYFASYNTTVGSTENILSSCRIYDTGVSTSYRLITYGIYFDTNSVSNTIIGNDLTDTYLGAVFETSPGNVVMARDAGPAFTFNCRINAGSIVPIQDSVYQLGTSSLIYDRIYVDKIYLGDASTTIIKSGPGSPAGAIAGTPGSMYIREDGDGYRWRYIKTRNSDDTGWVPDATTINLKWCGAVGDGVTDDTAAIQSAFSIASSLIDSITNVAGGSRAGTIAIHVPRGRYLYVGNTNPVLNGSGILSYGFEIRGDGQSASQIDWAPSGTVTSEQALLDFSATSFAHIRIKDVGFRISNSHTQAVAVRVTGSTNGPQDNQIEGCSFYNFANAFVADGTDLTSEWVFLRNRFLGDNNQAAILIRGTDQSLNWNFYGNTWLCTKGTFIEARKGGGIRLHGLNAFNTSSSATSGTITGRQLYVNAAAASGAKANLRSCGSNYSYVSGMNLRFVDGQAFTLNASGTFTTGSDTVQPTAANLSADLRDKSLAVVWPTVVLGADFNANDTDINLQLSGGPTSETIKRGDKLRVGTSDTATYTCIEDGTITNAGVRVKIWPVAQATTTSGAAVHCRAPAVFELLGATHARGVTSFSCIGWRPEHRNADSRSLYCEWQNGTVLFMDCDESVQSSTGRPLWTHWFDIGNSSGPRITFTGCVFHGNPVFYYHQNAYDKHPSARYVNCTFRVGTDPFTNFCFRPQNTVNSSDHTNIGSVPVVYCEGVKGDTTLATDAYANDAILNGYKAYHSSGSSVVRFRHQGGLSPGANTTLQIYVTLNALLRRIRIWMRPGATANVTAGCTYTVQTSDGTVHAIAAPDTLNLGFDIDVKPANGAFVCDTEAKRIVQLVTNGSISAQVQDFFCEVEYV